MGQIARFRFEIEPGDYVLTPDIDTEWLHVGVMQEGHSYVPHPKGGCHYMHWRPVKWLNRVCRADFAIPFQASTPFDAGRASPQWRHESRGVRISGWMRHCG